MVTIKQLLDREVHSNVLLTVSAHSSDRPTATSAAVLNVTIVDSNDNRPQFDQVCTDRVIIVFYFLLY